MAAPRKLTPDEIVSALTPLELVVTWAELRRFEGVS